MKYSQKTLHSSPERARYGVSFVSSKGNILCRLVKIELYKIFAIINRAIKGLHCMYINCANSRCHLGKWRCHTRPWYPIPCRLLLYCRLHRKHTSMCGWLLSLIYIYFSGIDNQGGGVERPSMAWHIWSWHWHICNLKLLLSYLLL